MNYQTRFQICCHESAHAVLAHFLKTRRVEDLNVVIDALGFVSQGKIYKQKSPIRERYENLIIISAAGTQAGNKARFIPYTITGAPPANISKPPAQVKKYRNSVIPRLIKGSDADCEPDRAFEDRLAKAAYPDTAGPYTYWLHQRAAKLVERYWPLIQAVAVALFHQDYLSRREFLAIVKNHKEAK